MNHRRYTYFTGEDILLLKRRYTSFLKETHRSFIRGGMGALLLWLLLLTACVGEELQKPLLGEGEGYLTLQIGAISAEVTSDPLTKATLENLPDSTEFTIVIKDTNGNEVKHYDKLSLIDNPLVLNAGVKYIVEASYGTNNALQDIPYFYGSDSIYIQANTNNQVTVNASLANAMIIPVVTESLKKHYENNWKLTASVGETSLLLASAEAGIDTLYAHADSIVSLTFTGKNKAGQYVSFKWTDTIAVKACKAYMMQCNPDLSAFENIQVTATATHTKDSSGDLNGTDVTFNADINDEYKAAIDSFKIQVFNSNQQVIRTYTGNTLDQMTYSDTDWPYIPQGSTLSASVKLKAGDEITVGSTFALPAPDFVVAVTGTTSYDLYLAEKISEANGMNAETIEGIGATAKISDALLSNPNYSHTFTLTYDNETLSSETSTITVGDKTGQSWGNHPITATMVFDGQSIEAKKDCHITGLPYKAVPPKKSGNHPWIDNAGDNKWTDNCVQLYYSFNTFPIIVSPAFHVPSNIKVGITTRIYREYYWASVSKGDLCIYQYNTSTKKENRLYQAKLAREETYEPSTPLIAAMTSELPAFFIRYNYKAATGYTNVYYFNVAYQSE